MTKKTAEVHRLRIRPAVLWLVVTLAATTSLATHASGLARPLYDAFGVPTNFNRSYKLISDKDTGIGRSITRRSVKIVVPPGLSAAAVQYNTLAAAEAAYKADGLPNAIMVFAYKSHTNTALEYTAGRLIWAPGGEWTRARERVSVQDHRGVFDLSDDYSDAADGKSAGIAKIMAEQASVGKDAERPLLRHFSERTLKRIFYAIEQGIQDEVSNPSISGNVEGSLAERKAAICRKYHISSSDYETLRDVGEAQNWPGPDLDTH